MLGDIIKKEILDNLLSHKFLFIFILCSALILFSIYIGASDYVESKKEYDANMAVLGERMQPPETTAFFIEREGYRIYRPPQVLRTIVAGVEDAAGRASYPNKWYENNLTESKNESNAIFTLFGSLDIMFAVKFVLSLFAIFFAYDAVSGEKEKGTLKLMLSNSVSRNRLISGKIIGNYLSMLLLFLTPLLMGLVLLSVYPGVSLNDGDWTRLLFIFLMFLLYISVFFVLGIFVSALTARPSTSFLVLLFLWIALVIVIPGASVVVAEHVRPVQASSLLMAEKGTFFIQLQQKVMAEYLERQNTCSQRTRPNSAPADLGQTQEYSRKFSECMEELTSKSDSPSIQTHFAQMDRDYQLKKEAQQSLAKNISRVSPASALTFGGMTLARTGTDEYDRFLAATRTYRWIYRNWDPATGKIRTESVMPGAPLGMFVSGGQSPIDANVIANIPRLQFEPERLGESLNRTLTDFALMAAMTIILLVGAFFAFMRYDVR